MAGADTQKWALSGTMYDYLREHLGPERALFGHAFDLPLQTITLARYREDLLAVLGTELPAAADDEDEGIW
jgi:hypothetical protein